MSVIYNRVFITTCPGDLIATINADPLIGVTLQQIVNDGSSVSQFWFENTLTNAQENRFDTVLTTFSCPTITETSTENTVVNDTSIGTDILWSSSQIVNQLGNYIPTSQTGVPNGVATLDSSGKLTLSQLPTINFPVTSVFGRTGNIIATKGDYSLTQLSDVSLTPQPTNGQVLKYNGTSWVNANDNTGLAFVNFSVPGQNTIVADSENDTITLIAGTGISITTNSTTDTITISSTGGSTSPGGSNTHIQFNDNGVFGGETNHVYDKTNKRVEIHGPAQTTRQILHSGTSAIDTSQLNKSVKYIQVDGDSTYEGMRIYYKRSSAGISGWLAYHYDQYTPNIRLTDEDDDPPYIAFNTVSTGTYDNPLHVSVFGARGPYGSRDTATDYPGFAWFIGNNTNPTSLISNYQPVMELDSQWLKIPAGTTAQRPTTPSNGMVRYNTTTNKFEGYQNGSWVDLVASGSSTFGQNFQQASSDVECSTTSTTYQQKVTMTTPSLPSGTYRIGYSAEIRNNTTSQRTRVQVQINDTITIGTTEVEPQDPLNYETFCGFYYYTGSGVLTIDMDWNVSGNSTGYIRNARLEIWRVA